MISQTDVTAAPVRHRPTLPPHPRGASGTPAAGRAGRLARRLIVLGLTATILTTLPGCGALIVGGVAVGAATLHDRRPYYVVIDDQDIELSAMKALLQDPDIGDGSRISVTSYNRTVLLTGQAESTEVAQHATDLIRRLPKVQRVIDELTIGPKVSLARKSQDVYLTSRAKLALSGVDLPDFDVTRVKIVTEDGVVYLMGLVSPEEADAAAEQVRYVPGVRRVVKLFEYESTDA